MIKHDEGILQLFLAFLVDQGSNEVTEVIIFDSKLFKNQKFLNAILWKRLSL